MLRTLDLSVLIWGPGERRADYPKRQKIREVLKAYFPNADVYFSEDEELKQKVPFAQYQTIPEQELSHLAYCDLCIVLDTSPGTAAEIAHFANSSLAYKLYILTHEKDKDLQGFAPELRRRKNQEFYTEEEWRSCNLTLRAVARARQIALEQFTGLHA